MVWGVLVSPKIRTIGLGDTPKGPEIIEIKSLTLSHKQIEKLKVQIEAKKYYGAFENIISTELP